VARPAFVTRTGDRRLLTGAASPVRIFPPGEERRKKARARQLRPLELWAFVLAAGFLETRLLSRWVNKVGLHLRLRISATAHDATESVE
jgi:hypothetical protein